MTYLLDTHVLLWWLDDAKKLSPAARKLIAAAQHVIGFSAVSVWELRIKQALGKVSLPQNFAEVLSRQAFVPLPVTIDHAHAIETLPAIHGDPFDRMLVAQCLTGDMTLVTHDALLQQYPIACVLV